MNEPRFEYEDQPYLKPMLEQAAKLANTGKTGFHHLIIEHADWRRVSADHDGAAVWPAPEKIDVLAWIMERHQNATSGNSGDAERRE